MTSCECCKGACCAPDGTCTQETKQDCDDAGGVWQGNAEECGDYDCSSGCCEEVTVDTCTLSICQRGYNSGVCDPVAECDPTVVVTPPTSGVSACKDGTPTSATVTGAGVTFNTGNPLLDADLDDMLNASYAINFECNGTHDGTNTETDFSYTGNYGPYTVRVYLSFQSVRDAGINVFDFNATPPLLAGMARNDGAATVYTSECATVYECDPFSGAVTSSAGAGDYTNATIDAA